MRKLSICRSAEKAHNTERNGANCNKAGNDKNNSNEKVEIWQDHLQQSA